MPPGKFNHLGDFRFRDLECEDAADAHAAAMDVQHHIYRSLAGLAENLFQYVDDEFHRRVIVVQQENLVERRFLGLGARLGDDPGAGGARPVLVVVVGIARILQSNAAFLADLLARLS